VDYAGRILGAAAYSASLDMLASADASVTRVWEANPGIVAADICGTLQATVQRPTWEHYLPGFPYTPICR
jgi:hypothetical protein